MNAEERRRGTPVWRQMEMGADIFSNIVKWVVIFEPLVKKIGCNDRQMCYAYLRVRDSSNFFCINRELARRCKNDAIFCHATVKQPLFEIKVCIWAGKDRGWDTSICFVSCKNALGHMPRVKMSSRASCLLTSVLLFHVPLTVLELQQHYGVR